MIRPALVVPLLLAACSSSPDPQNRVPAPEEAKRELDLRKADEHRRDFQATLIRLDQAMDSYVHALASRGETRADQQAERLEKSIRDMVLDTGPVSSRSPAPSPGENFRHLQAAAADASDKYHQGIALAALGFSGQRDMMPLILPGAQSDDPFLVDRAVLGLAVLRAPSTPPGVLAAICERTKHPEEGRAQAAWALYCIQSASENQAEIVAIWRRFVGEQREALPPSVLVTAIRGLGLARDVANADLVGPFLEHPTPRLRMAAAIALARMNAQKYAPALIERLQPAETVQNVRLAARKALSDLAGGDDYGYDVTAWRKVFDRGR